MATFNNHDDLAYNIAETAKIISVSMSVNFDQVTMDLQALQEAFGVYMSDYPEYEEDDDYIEPEMDDFDEDDGVVFEDLDIDDGDEDYIQNEIAKAPAVKFTKSISGLDLSFLLEDENRPKWQAEKAWTKIWPDIDLTIDPCQAAADNYLLFGIANNSFVDIIPQYYPSEDELRNAGTILGIDPDRIGTRVAEVLRLSELDPTLQLEELNRQADTQYRILIDRLDVSFRQYSHLACGGELRHMLKSDPFYSQNRNWAWAEWGLIWDKYGLKSLEVMINMFIENGWGAYGGKKWAAAAECLLGREAGTLGPDELTNKQLFIDRVFTLQHNTGSFLNKQPWSNNRAGRNPGGGHWATMKDNVLPAHCANPVDIKTMYHYASEGVQHLLTKYFDLALEHGLEINGVWDDPKPAILVKTEVKNNSSSQLDWSDVPDYEEEEVDPIELKASPGKTGGVYIGVSSGDNSIFNGPAITSYGDVTYDLMNYDQAPMLNETQKTSPFPSTATVGPDYIGVTVDDEWFFVVPKAIFTNPTPELDAMAELLLSKAELYWNISHDQSPDLYHYTIEMSDKLLKFSLTGTLPSYHVMLIAAYGVLYASIPIN